MAKDVSKLIEPYFSHDMNARNDEKILKLFFEFRKLSKKMTKEELEPFVALGAYGIFWSIIEYMHRNILKIDDIELISDDLRIDKKYIEIILNDFNLFKLENDSYISERILRNLKLQNEKSQAKVTAANKRWALSSLNKYYQEIYDCDIHLSDEEINKFYKFSESINNFKEKLPDILYSLKFLHFEDKPNFNPDFHWLLKKDEFMTTFIDGGYGKLKSYANYKAAKEEAAKEQARYKANEYQTPEFNSKQEAMKYLVDKFTNLRLIVGPPKRLLEQWNITVQELQDFKKEIENG